MEKRGGLRVIYFWEVRSETFYLLMVYHKNDQEDLTSKQVVTLQRLVKEGFK
jgi:hypothetical protein